MARNSTTRAEDVSILNGATPLFGDGLTRLMLKPLVSLDFVVSNSDAMVAEINHDHRSPAMRVDDPSKIGCDAAPPRAIVRA